MNVRGTRAAMSFSAEPDIREWANGVALNPARVPAGHPGHRRWTTPAPGWPPYTAPALARLTDLMGG